ncbi:MAG TPA: PQQ-dependent sugar dehydrogenase [Mucilaginibacter sp.]|nr:PQQ-dependent sugar dehydrogenase [Mucilaginibacter sp.]
MNFINPRSGSLLFGLFIIVAVLTGFKLWQTPQQPNENRFKRVVLVKKLYNPMELDIAKNGDIYLIEAPGRVSRVNPETKAVTVLGEIKGHDNSEYGLIGFALDPNFEKTHWIYVQYFLPQKAKVAQISRFSIINDKIDLSSEKKYVQVPYDETCCHAGGSMSFDSKGNLYFSTGDNSDAFQYVYAPVDERPGHEFVNSFRSAANTMDLRGKISRIHPENNGTYSIPKGNLFPDMKNARPEIYVMGLRNPYRIFVDKTNDVLYWGEVGPDARIDSAQGPLGFDEFNVAPKAGNFGWPMFAGNNQAYAQMDFDSKRPGAKFDPAHPVNNSRLNTGVKNLPPAQSAAIWYPYKSSDEFPELGEGSRAAIGGPVYHYDPDLKSAIKFPAYYDKKWFIADWVRTWLKAVTLGADYKTRKIESFMPGTKFLKPMDMAFSPKDGALYMLEYGDTWDKNDEACLVRIEYTAGNRPPVAKIESDKLSGKAPLVIGLSGKSSYDDDHDVLKYSWLIDGKRMQGRDIKYTFNKNGVHKVALTVTDPSGLSNTKAQMINVGNSIPVIRFELPNHTFYFDSLAYRINVTDAEDGKIGKGIAAKAVKVTYAYQPKSGVVSQSTNGKLIDHGEVMLNESDCKSCHKIDGTSIGPSFIEVARRYAPTSGTDEKIVKTLANKIITGGSGVWFKDRAMAPHPQLNIDQTSEIVRYILSLALKNDPPKAIPVAGNLVLNEYPQKPKTGFYTFTASYTDRGANGIKPLTATTTEILRSPKITAEEFDEFYNQPLKNHISIGLSNSYVVIKHIDLTSIKRMNIRYKAAGGAFEVHLDNLNGQQIGSFPLSSKLREVASTITPTKDKHDLYIIYRNGNNVIDPMQMEWVSFGN